MARFTIDAKSGPVPVNTSFRATVKDNETFLSFGSVRTGSRRAIRARQMPLERFLEVYKAMKGLQPTNDEALSLVNGIPIRNGISFESMGFSPDELLGPLLFSATAAALAQTQRMPIGERPIVGITADEWGALCLIQYSIDRDA